MKPGTRRPSAGAPPLAVNEWLAEQVRAHPELRTWPVPRACRQVYAEWRRRHEQERGYKLVEPHRSYRAALRTIVNREERT